MATFNVVFLQLDILKQVYLRKNKLFNPKKMFTVI